MLNVLFAFKLKQLIDLLTHFTKLVVEPWVFNGRLKIMKHLNVEK